MYRMLTVIALLLVLFVALGGLAGAQGPGPVIVDPTPLNGPLYPMQRSGLVVVHTRDGQSPSTSAIDWRDMPRLKGAFTIQGTSNVALTLCADVKVTGGGAVWARVLVDGLAARPTEVRLAASSEIRSHCFTFIYQGLSAGVHQARLQWRVEAGSSATLNHGALTIAWAQPNADEFRLAAVSSGPGAQATLSGGWTDIPGVQATIQPASMSDLAMTVSAEVSTTPGARLFLRALYDGQVVSPSDVIFSQSGGFSARSFTFVKTTVSSSSHTVRIQASVDGGQATLGAWSLTVASVNQTQTKTATRRFIAAPSGAERTTQSPGFVDVPNLNGIIDLPVASDLALTVSAEMRVSDGQALYLQAFLDWQPIPQGDVRVVRGDDWDTSTFTFVIPNVKRGQHDFRVRWQVDNGGTAGIGDRTLTALAFSHEQPVLFIAMESTRPANDPTYALGGLFASSVVDRSGSQPVFLPYVRQRLFGSVVPSVADAFLEMSGGRYFMVEAGLLGPYLKTCGNEAQCRNRQNPFALMKTEAVQRADRDFDFSLYDRDGDGVVNTSELAVSVIFHEDSFEDGQLKSRAWGEVRGLTPYASQDGVTVNFGRPGLATLYLDDFNPAPVDRDDVHARQTGVILHELSHQLFNAGDLYTDSDADDQGDDAGAPGPGIFSLMDADEYHSHLDPYHKLRRADWTAPVRPTRDGWYTLDAVGRGGEIYKLALPGTAGDNEYFLVENRQSVGYDSRLSGRGLLIWHIDEARGRQHGNAARWIVELETANGVFDKSFASYPYDGTNTTWGRDFWRDSSPRDSRYHNGSDSGIGVWGISPSGPTMRAFLDVPGPGVLLQARPPSGQVWTNQTTTINLRVRNTGSARATFDLTTTLPDGWGTITPSSVTLDPYQEVFPTLALRPQTTQAGPYNFSVMARDAADSSVVTPFGLDIDIRVPQCNVGFTSLRDRSVTFPVTLTLLEPVQGQQTTPYGTTVPCGSTLRVTAPSTVGSYRFSRWVNIYGQLVSQNTALTLTISGDVSLVAQYSLELVVSPTPTPTLTPPPPSSSASVLVQAQCEGCPQGVTVFGGVTMTFTAPPYGQRPTPFLMDLTPGTTLTVTAPATANAGGTPVRFLRWMAIGTGRSLGTSTTLTVAVTGSETYAAVYGP